MNGIKASFGVGSIVWLLVSCSSVSVGPGSTSGDDDDNGKVGNNPEAVTYYRDILPIVYDKCAACHTAGGAAFALDTYDAARPMAPIMTTATASGRMPPWPPDTACSDFTGSEHRTLSPAQIDLIGQWAQLGAPAGDPADAPAPPQPEPDLLGPPDVQLDPGGDFNFGNQAEDLYYCFRMDPKLTAPRDLIGATITPGNNQIVHHVIVFKEDGGIGQPMGMPGFECGGVPSGTEFLFAWVPGAEPTTFPPDHGMPLDTDDALVMQVHYHAVPGAPPTDRTSADIWWSDTPVGNPVRVLWTGSIDINVPAGGQSTATGTCDVPAGAAPVKVLSVAPHMHEIGTRVKSVVEHADGSETCMIDIPDWDFDWQGGYQYRTPLMIQPGDTIRTTCNYDNTTGANVSFGEGTGDEMCFQFNFVVDDGSLPDMCFAPCTFIDCSNLF